MVSVLLVVVGLGVMGKECERAAGGRYYGGRVKVDNMNYWPQNGK